MMRYPEFAEDWPLTTGNWFMRISPTAEGFRAAFRRPSFALAEISWRWVIGATATAVFFFGLFEYLNTLPVTGGDLLFLRSRQPFLIGQALAHIFRGSLARGVIALLLAAMLVALLWMIAGSIGRIATVRALRDYFRARIGETATAANNTVVTEASNTSTSPSAAAPVQALVRLNFLRIVAAVAAVLGLVGATILAGFVSTNDHPRPGLAFFLFLPLGALVCLAWFLLNWLLSLSGMFAVRDGKDVMGAISSAVTFCRERTGAVAAVSTWTGLAHLTAFVIATTVLSFPMAFARLLPGRIVALAVILVTLTYFAVADWLYTARLAGYVCIAEAPEALLRPAPPPVFMPQTPLSALTAPVQATIDEDELILSDIPSTAPHARVGQDEVILSDKPDERPQGQAITDAKRVSEMVEQELANVADTKLSSRVRELLVPPYPVERVWDYGLPGEHFTCWTILEHHDSNTGIAYCEHGFGPRHPWGLVFLSGPHMNIGMDSAWFVSLEDAMRDSMAWGGANPARHDRQ